MNLIELNVEEMVTVTETILDPNGAQLSLVAGDPLLAGLVPMISKAHEELRSAQRASSQVEERARQLTQELSQLDAAHDRKARGVFNGLSALQDLTDDSDEAARYARFQTLLFPQGLWITRQNYRTQAGSAMRVQEQLTPGIRAEMDAVACGSASLLARVDEWLDAGLLIGRLEAERAHLKARARDAADGMSLRDIQNARYFWVQIMQNLINLLALSDLDAAAQQKLLANVEDASQKAQARRRASVSADSPDLRQGADADSASHSTALSTQISEPADESV